MSLSCTTFYIDTSAGAMRCDAMSPQDATSGEDSHPPFLLSERRKRVYFTCTYSRDKQMNRIHTTYNSFTKIPRNQLIITVDS